MLRHDTAPGCYRHWTLAIEPPIATLTLGIAGCGPAYGGDAPLAPVMDAHIELADVVQRLRFEHPDVGAVVLTGSTDDAFCTGIGNPLPPGSPQTAPAAVDVDLFAGEVRCAIEDASANSGQHWLAALNGSASGAGYELALATEEILLIDDGRSAVALPDLPSLGRLPATGALARLLHKRRVRPDVIDLFCTQAEGVPGQRAQDWGLVDRVVAPEHFANVARQLALTAAGRSQRPAAAAGVRLDPLQCEEFEGGFAYPDLRVELDQDAGTASLTLVAPKSLECFAPDPGPKRLRSRWWPLAACRELDDALLLLRAHWPAVRTLIVRTEGDPLAVAAADVALMTGYEDDWFVREVVLYWRRTLQRLERMPQSLIVLVEPGSCFVGTLLELAFSADRAYMLDGPDPDRPDLPAPEIFLTGMNFGPLPNGRNLTRLETRFPHRSDRLADLANRVADPIAAAEATRMGLVTAWIPNAECESSMQQVIEERRALAPEALARLTGNLRVGGPEAL
jgi:benzoyl-CoA-dihydrodiol lyase